MPAKRQIPAATTLAAEAMPSFTDLVAGWGSRLRLARAVVAPSAKALAEQCGVSPQRWSHWERERHPPAFAAMLVLKHRHGVSLDWIYAGDPSGMRGWLIQQMLGVPANKDVEAAQLLLRSTLLAGGASAAPGAFHETQRPR